MSFPEFIELILSKKVSPKLDIARTKIFFSLKNCPQIEIYGASVC